MKFITSIFLVSFLAVQVPYVEATTIEADLHQQVEAITEYLKYQTGTTDKLTTEEMRAIILEGADWVATAQESNGHFGYEYLPLTDKYRNDDNMVRQAGSLFMISEVYKHQIEKDEKLADTIERSIAYFENLSEESEPEDGDFLCIKDSKTSKSCALGSVALALIGVLNYVEVHPEKEQKYEEIIDKYSSYLMEAKFHGAGFSNKYRVGIGFTNAESPFFNGEAMLALVRYYQYDKDPEVKKVLNESFDYLAAKEEFESPLYLWMMAALKDMNTLWPSEAYGKYASTFTTKRIADASRRHVNPRNYCAVLEGMTSAYTVLEKYESASYLARLNIEIEFWLGRSDYLQQEEQNPYRLVIEDGQIHLGKVTNVSLATGGFFTSTDEPTQRIDFTQHCTSAYLQKLVDIDGMAL